MKQEILLKQRIGARLVKIGALSKVFAIQTFSKNNIEITPEQFAVLMALKDNDGMYQRQLATLTFKDRPNITRIVAILEKGGYIKSQNASSGRLVKKLFITEKGINICEEILPIVLEIWKETINGISEEEMINFVDTLNKIEINIREKTTIQI